MKRKKHIPTPYDNQINRITKGKEQKMESKNKGS